ncbi:MAG: hypothetical protein NXI07_07470 [bacterium]|nr:hypothetical protein [bacterium]
MRSFTYVRRSMLVAHGSHPCDLKTVVGTLTSFHGALREALGRHCRVHATINKEDVPGLCTLEEMDERFHRMLLDWYPPYEGQALLNATLSYETRTRVAQATFIFDHTIGSVQISFTAPVSGLARRHVIALAESIIGPLGPQWLTYNNRALVDSLYGLYPNFFRTAWLTYHAGFPTELPRYRTLEEIQTTRGPMMVAKPRWFARTDESLLEDLVELDAQIEGESPYGS